jgi:hypothetical protein
MEALRALSAAGCPSFAGYRSLSTTPIPAEIQE